MRTFSLFAIALLATFGVEALPVANPVPVGSREPRSMTGKPYMAKRQVLPARADNPDFAGRLGDGRTNVIPGGPQKRDEGYSRRKRQGWLYSSPNTDNDDNDRHNAIPGTG